VVVGKSAFFEKNLLWLFIKLNKWCQGIFNIRLMFIMDIVILKILKVTSQSVMKIDAKIEGLFVCRIKKKQPGGMADWANNIKIFIKNGYIEVLKAPI
jgi:hypothetical protein